MKRILVTGARGFVGSHWFESSHLRDQSVPVSLQSQGVSEVNFDGIDTVVHMAGIAHRMGQPSGSIYYEVNRDMTLALARRARQAGVQQFVYLSSVKVMGDEDGYFDENSLPQPVDDYGKSKFEAEAGLSDLACPDFTVSIVRPPLVYGPRVKGNVLRIMDLIARQWPLPLDGIENARSMVYVLNLVALIERVIELRAGGVFIAGDAAPISTTQLVRGLAQGMGLGSSARHFALPRWVQAGVSRTFPKIGRRLFESYVVSNADTNHRLQFEPPTPSLTALIETGRSYQRPLVT